jgi:undecaprenyl diphosphate synthase
VLTLFAFSSENWGRPAEEVSRLMELFVEAMDREVDELQRNGIRLRFIGDFELVRPELVASMRAAEARTAANTSMTLYVALSYGGRWDIARAARRLAARAAAGELDPAVIDERLLEGELCLAGAPEVDLFIRTGGEQRISNFLLWNLAYAELYFVDTLWPDFDDAELDRALRYFAARQRRFGLTGEQVAGG